MLAVRRGGRPLHPYLKMAISLLAHTLTANIDRVEFELRYETDNNCFRRNKA